MACFGATVRRFDGRGVVALGVEASEYDSWIRSKLPCTERTRGGHHTYILYVHVPLVSRLEHVTKCWCKG